MKQSSLKTFVAICAIFLSMYLQEKKEATQKLVPLIAFKVDVRYATKRTVRRNKK